jgi:pyridoxal phosphate enzyme (YggS family)
MSLLVDRIHALIESIPSRVSVVLATKYANVPDIGVISSAYPHLIFGENRVQSGRDKQSAYPDILNPWHFIGHLQRNKVAHVVQQYQLIQSVDSIRLLDEIDRVSKKRSIITPVLLQVNPCHEDTKHGFTDAAALDDIEFPDRYPNLNVMGLMAMAPHTDNTQKIIKTFKKTRAIYDKLLANGLPLTHLSMGMSHDYKIAIDHGSTMVRIGSKVFK